MESEAQLVASALAKLKVQGAVVVGHSLGGAVATALAQQASQLVDRLVIIDEAPDNELRGLHFLAQARLRPGARRGDSPPRARLRRSRAATSDAFAPGLRHSSGFDDPDQVVEDFRAMTYTSYDDSASGEDDFTKAEPLDARIRGGGGAPAW